MTVSDFLSGVKVLEKVESPINGEIQVVRSFGLGTYIQVEGLTQSGGVVGGVWKTTLKKLKNEKVNMTKCLILGLGAGSAAGLVRKYWPRAKITGVEIDPAMVELGKKYLGLEEVNVKVVIQDALEFLTNYQLQITNDFDLILVDLYIGRNVPEKFTTEAFIQLVKSFLSESRDSPSRGLSDEGRAVFNRLYYDEKRKEAEKFHRKLIHAFRKVRPIYPEANVMFICEA